ncbi:MAG: S1 RNA-binding domain-containing protein [Planctomycetaceae bacterium]|nr:S1 RNA-binding domain-containing protein [Planctomycetaceae bacterium]
MNTEQTRPEDQTPVQGAEPSDAAVAANAEANADAAPDTTTVASADADTVSAPAPGSTPAAEAAAETPSSEAPRRKIQLNPVMPGQARPIPSLGEGTPAQPMPTGPVELPSDEEVDAAIARAVGAHPTAEASAPENSPAAVTPAPVTPSAASAPASGGPASAQPAQGAAAEKPMAPTVPEAKKPIALPEMESLDSSMEAMLDAALAENDAPQPSGGDGVGVAPATPDELTRGTKLSGTVQAVNEENVLLDFRLRMSGCVPTRQFGQKLPEVGSSIDVVVDRVDDKEGLIFTNLPRDTSKVQGDWDALQVDQVIECMVSKTNKGGLDVAVGSLRGFLPASQVEIGFVADLEGYVGQKLRVVITEVKPQRRRLVVSRRKLLAEERDAARKELMEKLQVDDVISGRVKSVKDFGAFVDLGGTDGFLPISQMSWARIGHPNEIVQVGQEIEVKVLSIDEEKQRISLGMRQLAPNPWKLAESKYPPGSKATGKVTRTETFGAFVELEPGLEGLVHISELDYRRVARVTEVLNVGDMTEVQIVEVLPGKKRISLSVKALKEKPEEPKDEDQAPGGGQSYQRKRRPDKLKGGTGGPQAGGLFGNPKDFT